jgi:spore coat protein U-like protein
MLMLTITGICYSADTAVMVTATVLSKSICKFNAATAVLNFGDLDPANPVDKTVTTTVTFVCRGSADPATFVITDDDGLYANKMYNPTYNDYLPYSLTFNPQADTVPRNVDQTLTISGTVLGADFQDVSLGSYSDTVVLTISP